jgi:6-methylsalicylate decarboxylase
MRAHKAQGPTISLMAKVSKTMQRRIFFASIVSFVIATQNNAVSIIQSARADGIDLFSVDFAADALSSIQEIYNTPSINVPEGVRKGSIVDVHAHIVPPWYRAAVPFTGQSPTPNWTLEEHLGFMANNSIRHSVLSISSPGSVLFPGSEVKSVALARLLNEYLAAVYVTRLPLISC